VTENGISRMIMRRGWQCGVEVVPHRRRHHVSHAWLDQGGAYGDLMKLNGWTFPRRCFADTAPAYAPPSEG
jgi:hypothetical protein